ncbi:MAG TPA: Tex-like N-terminal domain-containing protein, partial [Pedobacter sp.]
MESKNKYSKQIANEQSINERQVLAAISLLEEGATVPFISRYRKEMTGSLDEVQIAAIRDRVEQLKELDKRREAILKSLTEMEKLSPELEKLINAATTLSLLEDIYLPYRPKRKTRASVAKEKGLQPLADLILDQAGIDLISEAGKFINPEKGVTTLDEALAGARDIVAETVSEHIEARAVIRKLFVDKGVFECRVIPGKEEAGIKYRDYFEW